MTIKGQLLFMLQAVAEALGDELRARLVFVGGCTTALLQHQISAQPRRGPGSATRRDVAPGSPALRCMVQRHQRSLCEGPILTAFRDHTGSTSMALRTRLGSHR
ncbi:MAG: hypothetical protein E5X08_26700 [Mesorhizobium sp.]|nr:MAG: hypothetical protein E5X08_26700 [Mesorhizobium sp.]